MSDFLSGATMIAAASVGLFFFRSWWRSRDRLFLFFGASFGLLAVERWVLALVPTAHEFRPFVYLIRLAAFALILGGIAEKNRSLGR